MSGYSVLFPSMITGSLHGKWPDIGLWPIILALADKNGVVDVTPSYIASVTGLALAEVVACMWRFCAPDPESRTNAFEGAKLVLLEEHRDWGWRVVNHGKYREKARKAAFDADRTASGRDAERKRQETSGSRDLPTSPEVSRVLPTPPAVSRELPLSDSDTDTVGGGAATRDNDRPARNAGMRLPDNFELTSERKAIAESEHIDPERTFAKFCDYWRAASGANARKQDWDATWRNWCRSEADRGRKPQEVKRGLPRVN